MTVGELKKATEGLSDDLPVRVMLPGPDAKSCCCASPDDDGYAHTRRAYFSPESSISNPEFMIECGDTYDY